MTETGRYWLLAGVLVLTGTSFGFLDISFFNCCVIVISLVHEGLLPGYQVIVVSMTFI